jgi:integrase
MSAKRAHGDGWLQIKKERWVYRFHTTRASDGRIVENTKVIGLLSDFPTEDAAWAEVDRQHLRIKPRQGSEITFADLAHSYMKSELRQDRDAIRSKAKTTQYCYRHIIEGYLIPRWGDRLAKEIEPLEIEQWLESLHRDSKLEWPTLDKTRRVMNLVYDHGQRQKYLPRGEEGNPLNLVRCKTQSEYEAIIVTPEQVFTILQQLPPLERVLTLLTAATGLRISEGLGLQWRDIDHENSQIYVRRSWNPKYGVCPTKTTASKAVVPMHPLLAGCMKLWQQETPYPQTTDWVFPSFRLAGKKPRDGNMLVQDHLRPAALRIKVKGVEDQSRRFGFHNLRHGLSTYLVKAKVDPKIVQTIMRHKDISTTLNLYTQTMSEDRIEAQGLILEKLMQRPINRAVN